MQRLRGCTLALLLGLASTALASPPLPVAVERLRHVLMTPVHDTRAVAPDLRLRRSALLNCLAGLRSCQELRDALLLQEWRDQDPDAMLALVDSGARGEVERRFVGVVRELLGGTNGAGRLGACGLLGELGGKLPADAARQLTPALADLIRRDDPVTSSAALETLGAIHPPAVDAVAVFDEVRKLAPPTLRRQAAKAFGTLIATAVGLARNQAGETDDLARADVTAVAVAVTPAAGRCLVDGDADVRRLGLEALRLAVLALEDLARDRNTGGDGSRAGRREADRERTMLAPLLAALDHQMPALNRCGRDADPGVRTAAHHTVEALCRVRSKLNFYLLGLPAPLATLGVPLLPGRPDEPIPLPEQFTNDGFPQAKLRTPAEFQLVSASEPVPTDAASLNGLCAGLRDPNLAVRRSALDALETLGPAAAAATPAVLEATADPDTFVRWAATRTLGTFGPVVPDRTVPRLCNLLYDPDLDIRLTAAATLRRYGPAAAAAVPTLARIIDNGGPEIRLAAIAALATVGPTATAALPALRVALTDPQARVRRAAADLITALGPSIEAVEPELQTALQHALADEDATVRRAASDALISLTESTSIWTASTPFVVQNGSNAAQ